MKTLRTPLPGRRAFTLVEMIGVMSIVAILASLFVPRIIHASGQARVNSTTVSFNTLRTASMSYYGKYGRFGGVGGTVLDVTSPYDDWDTRVLLAEGLMEKPFVPQLGGSYVVRAVASTSAAVNGTNSAYSLDGASANSTSTGTVVLEVWLRNVDLDDARDLNQRLDGQSLGEASGLPGQDLKGRLKYDFAGSPTGDVHLYLTHK